MRKIKKFFNIKIFKIFSYFFLIILVILFLQWRASSRFFEMIELRTLDLRFGMSSKTIKNNPNIMILSIDDSSLEKLEDKFGRWPWNRNIYTETINYLELEGVDSIIFDLMFIGHQKGFENIDTELAKTIGKYENVYASMNFDYSESKTPPDLPDKLKIKVKNQSKTINFSNIEFLNCRLILDEIIDATPNIAFINFIRDTDGISRRSPSFIKYKNDLYPYLAFKAAIDYIKRHEHLKTAEFVINKDNQLLFGSKKIQLNNDSSMLINWYGPQKTFEHVPFWKVINSINSIKEDKNPILPPGYFKNKVVFIGVTATSLYDIKSVPLSSVFPGVEIEATVFNNIIDDNFIKKSSDKINLIICILLSIFVGILIIRLQSPLISSFITILTIILYIGLSLFLFNNYFIWIGIIDQIIVISITFTIMYVIKYLIKSKDFEYTYKLSTTDGLTNLYNHRYFEENLISLIEKTSKNKNHFSLLFVDIDFFKKFNDTYGHQAGDAVLRQVAETLKKSVKSSDFVARYGGEEMVIIIKNTDINKAISTADRICKTIANKAFKLPEGIEVNVTVSLGVATYPEHGKTYTELVEFADQGLYRAKRDGRNQVGKIYGTLIAKVQKIDNI
ncbi:MAG: diguanylate cyclase [bacterium]